MRRVIAIESLKEGHMRYYGEGVLIGSLHPDSSPIEGVSNPCIKLDNGKYIWGYQCWWDDVEKVREKQKAPNAQITSEEIVPMPDDIPNPTLRIGSIVMINERCSNKVFHNCFGVVSDVFSGGCIVDVKIPIKEMESHIAPIRVIFEQVVYIHPPLN